MRLRGLIAQLHAAEGSGIKLCSVDQSAQSVEKFAFIFQLHVPGRDRVLPFTNNPFLTIQHNPRLLVDVPAE